MSLLQKIIRILYPFIIWLGTLTIPLIITAAFIIIFEEKEDRAGDWFMLGWFALIGFAVSSPFFLIFSIIYAVCLFKKKTSKFTKRALHITNALNIIVSVIIVGGNFYVELIPVMLIGILVLLIPSTLLILFLKIPQKKFEIG